MSLDDAEKDDMGVENPLGIGLDVEKDEKEKNPHDQLTVAAALGCIAGKDRFADVYFLVGTGKDQKRIPAHRVILAAASDIFEAMLYPTVFPEDKKDSKSAAASTAASAGSAAAAPAMSAIGMGLDKEQEIEIADVKPNIFRLMLASVYGDTADIKADDLPDLIACAKKFQLEGLRQLCVTFMEEGVTVDNACQLFESAEKLLNEKQFALSFIEDNAADVIASPSFDALPKERVMTLIKSSKLAIDEIDLFKGVLRWSVAECKRQGIKDTIDNKKEVLKEVVPLVRFPVMAMEDVATFVSPSQILTPGQLLEVFTYLGQPDNKKPKVTFPTTARAGNSDKWTFESNFKSASLVLSNKNMTVKNNGAQHSYILGSVAWSKGIHTWRITRDQGPTQWFLVGVSQKIQFPDSSCNSAGFYGVSSAGQRYMNGGQTNIATNLMNGPIDCQYDADQGTLTIINLSSGTRHDVPGIPRGMPMCPHFGPHSNQQITVQAIRPKQFGKK